MLENERLVKARKKNMKIYPFYRALSIDIIFFYVTKLLFLTQVKGIPASHVVFSVSAYALSMVIFLIPATIVIQKIGYRKAAFLNNFFNMVYICIIMFSTNIIHLCIAEAISALAFSLKDIVDTSLLNISIPDSKNKGKIYSKTEGKGQAGYYFLDSVTGILAGIIYAVNPYLPFVLSITFSFIACILSLFFEEIKDLKVNEPINEIQSAKQYLLDLKKSFAFIFKSKRLRSLILYSGVVWGFMSIMKEYRQTILKDIGASSQIIGIIYAISGIASTIASRKQVEFHNKFRNHSLSIIIVTCSISMTLSGVVVLLGAPISMCICMILLASMVRSIDNSMNSILTTRYLANFTNDKILPKIYAANSMVKNLMVTIITIISSALLDITTSASAMVIVRISIFYSRHNYNMVYAPKSWVKARTILKRRNKYVSIDVLIERS